jgi:arylsulfatase A
MSGPPGGRGGALIALARGRDGWQDKRNVKTKFVSGRMVLRLAAAGAVGGLPAPRASAAADAAARRPNIIVILADDLGYGDVQCYNPERGRIPTPHLDRLVAQGMRFTDAHSSSAVCSPSRYTLLTGRYHWRSRLQRGIVGPWERPLIAPDRLTIAGLAKQNGYRTACVGKWHLGWDWPASPEERKTLVGYGGEAAAGRPIPTAVSDATLAVWAKVFSRPIAGGPITRGFDHYFGTDVPNWPPYCFIENDRTVGIPTELLAREKLGGLQASEQGPALKDWDLEKILPTLADRACRYIEEGAKKPEPFLLYMSLTSPHTPLAVTEEWKGRSGLGPYADFVMQTDAVVGRMMAALENSGAADHTLVIVTSDNGCAHYIGVPQMEAKGHYPSGPFRGYKFDVWEGGHREPFIVRWPGRVRAGTVCNQLVHQADVMATLADILGVALPATAGEDSFSLLPLFTGADRPVREHAVSCEGHRGTPGLRSGPWKLVCLPDPKAGTDVMLFNLDDDPGERKNLAAEQPDRVADMKALLRKLIDDGRSTPGAPQKNDVPVRIWK